MRVLPCARPWLGRVALAGAILLAASAEAKVVSTFPLNTGNYWVYRNLRFGSETRWEVTCRDGAVACLDLGFATFRLQDRGNATDIELGDEGFVLFYDFTAGAAFEHRDPFGCSDRVPVEVRFEAEDLVTAAGVFAGCLRLEFAASLCADAGTVTEWWAPGVGMIRRIEQNITGPVTIDLVEYHAVQVSSGFFRRGESNADGSFDISDPVVVLSWLGLGAASPPCLKAADSNDDGRIDISDAVWSLSYLFIGGLPPPDPFRSCGFDPTEDALGCDRFFACN